MRCYTVAFESLTEKLQNVFKNLRGKGRLSDIIGDEETIYHAIDGRKDRHAYGRQRKADQFSVGKVIR